MPLTYVPLYGGIEPPSLVAATYLNLWWTRTGLEPASILFAREMHYIDATGPFFKFGVEGWN